MANITPCLSTGNDEWATPAYIYKAFKERGYSDPCPMGGFIDGLSIEWSSKCFVNPPYSDLPSWIGKAIHEHKLGKKVVLLIPCRPDTAWFRSLWEYGCKFVLITGPLRFNDGKYYAPFPSMFVALRGTPYSRVELVSKDDLNKIIQEVKN